MDAKTIIVDFQAEHRWEIPGDGNAEFIERFGPKPDVLDRLRERYTASPVPPCPVCGAELTVASMGGGEATKYACSATRIGDDDWSQHYAMSRYTQFRSGDGEVIALLDAIAKILEG